MRPGGGKQKGAQFERDICKSLSLWVSHGAREDLFWRSAMSGGRATVGRKAGKDHAKHAGDISATHELGHLLTNDFYIEVKSYADLKFDSWLLKSEGPMAGFWSNTCEEAEHHKLAPMMIVKQDRSDPIMIVRCEHLLTPNESGLLLNPRAFMARFMRAKADLYSFAGVMDRQFEAKAVRKNFLKPGELVHILAAPGQVAGEAKQAALEEMVGSALDAIREVVPRAIIGEPKTPEQEAEMDAYYRGVDKWTNKKRRKAGLLKRIAQREDDEVSNAAGAGAPRTKSVRVRAD